MPSSLVAPDRVRGALSRLVRVSPDDLVQVATEDRHYVAAEMTAFLAAFLTSLDGRLLNAPDPTNLAGPPLGPEHWLRLADAAGLEVCTHDVTTDKAGWPEHVLVGEEVVVADGSAPTTARADAVRGLGRRVGAGHLGVKFCSCSDPCVAAVTTQPELAPPVWAILAQHLDRTP